MTNKQGNVSFIYKKKQYSQNVACKYSGNIPHHVNTQIYIGCTPVTVTISAMDAWEVEQLQFVCYGKGTNMFMEKSASDAFLSTSRLPDFMLAKHVVDALQMLDIYVDKTSGEMMLPSNISVVRDPRDCCFFDFVDTKLEKRGVMYMRPCLSQPVGFVVVMDAQHKW